MDNIISKERSHSERAISAIAYSMLAGCSGIVLFAVQTKSFKDMRDPLWEEAEKALTIAIDRRGNWEEKGWLFYEFNRALCRIKQDKAFADKKMCDNETKKKILSDLKTSANSYDLKELIIATPEIQEWLSVNNIRI